jgi:capsular polysaccharide biosynthesis protein
MTVVGTKYIQQRLNVTKINSVCIPTACCFRQIVNKICFKIQIYNRHSLLHTCTTSRTQQQTDHTEVTESIPTDGRFATS